MNEMMNYLLSFLQLVLNLNTRPFVIKCAEQTKREDMRYIFYDEITPAKFLWGWGIE